MAELTTQQQRVLQHVLDGESVFFTGSAGTGKSFLLKQIIQLLPAIVTFVTALSGKAAVPIGGTTLHSMAGIGLGNGTKEQLAARITPRGRRNWMECRTLIIDEVSMLSDGLFEKLEFIARVIRKNNAPFGGIQLVLVGDFFQIPPVDKKVYHTDSDIRMVFESPLWKRCVTRTVELEQIFRQTEPELVDLITNLRFNRITPEVTALMNKLRRELPEYKDGIQATRLYSSNKAVDTGNIRELKRLPGEMREFKAMDTGREPWVNLMSEYSPGLTNLFLKVGAQVIMLCNRGELVNGSQGVVTGFHPASGVPIVLFIGQVGPQPVEPNTWDLEDRSGKVLASRYQIPLKLAWCLTIHKSQGMTIERLVVKIDDAFEYGMSYTAMSRATSIANLQVSAWKPDTFKVKPEVLKFYESLGG